MTSGPVPQHSQKDPAGEVSQSELRVREAEMAADRLMDDVNELEAANARLRAINEQMLEALRILVADVQDYETWQRPCYAVDLARAAIAKARGRS